METLMAMKASFGGVNGIDNRQWWCRGDFQGSKLLRSCNIDKCRQPRMNNIHVSAISDFGIGVTASYDSHNNNNNGLVHEAMNDDGDEKTMTAASLDHLLHTSLTEIVKNVGEEPLLVHIHTENGPKHSQSSSSSSSTTKLKYVMEKVTSESWTTITQGWENNGYSTIPCGIIFVEELGAKQGLTNSKLHLDSYSNNYYNYNDVFNNNINYNNNNNNKDLMMESSSSNATRMWGVLVQGKGVSVPLCYLLKTCKVDCCFGSTTHFCLAKVDNNYFGNSVDFHLNKFWLQR